MYVFSLHLSPKGLVPEERKPAASHKIYAVLPTMTLSESLAP